MGPSWFLLAAAKKWEINPAGPSVKMVCGIEKLPIEPCRIKAFQRRGYFKID